MKPLLVGIDPGSTSAVAAVNLKEDLELLESGKNFPPKEIIRRIVKAGKPVIVASDKAETPSKVEKIANSFGAKIYEPEEDLSAGRKKKLGKGSNSHERDAVASALHAKRNLQRDISKIEKYDGEMEVPRHELAERILNDRPLKPTTGGEDETSPDENRREEEDNTPDEYRRRLERRIENLENHIEDLKSQLEEERSDKQDLEERIEDFIERDRKETVKGREVRKREAVIRDKNQEIKDLKKVIEDFKIRERQYRKAIQKIFEEGSKPVPIVEEDDEVPEEAVTRSEETLEKLQKSAKKIHHIEKVEGIELDDYIVVDELPSKYDFKSVIKEYE